MKLKLEHLREIIHQELRALQEQAAPDADEPIVQKVKAKMDRVDLTGEGGMLRMIDNKDEFEDLVRYIFNEVGFSNEKLGLIALKISQDFMKDPDKAAQMSKFNV